MQIKAGWKALIDTPDSRALMRRTPTNRTPICRNSHLVRYRIWLDDGPQKHRNIRILHADSKAQDKEISRIHAIFGILMFM